jgi:phage baseplate assembly protein V
MMPRDLSGSATRPGAGRITGVAVGLVIDNQDPQGLGRVRLRFPALSDDEIGHWARIAVLMAGADRGTFFLPEIGDEVLVAFENGDIARPYVLGGLWNGQDKPPETNADGKNNLRLVKSRSGHLIRLDDSDGAEKIEIVDKSGSNSIVVDTANNAITITSAADITIDAPQGTLKLSAQTIEISSSANTEVKPGGNLSLEASGNTTLKGAMVNIN